MPRTGSLLVPLILSWAAPAVALVPVERPWTPSPERLVVMVADHPAARPIGGIEAEGLRVASWRTDGSPALLWSVADLPPRNLHPDAAVAVALEAVRGLAGAFGVGAEDLVAGGLTALEGWTTVLIEQRHLGVAVRDGVVLVTLRAGQITMIRNELVTGLKLEATPVLAADDATSLAVDRIQAFAPSSTLVSEAELVIWAPADDATGAALAWVVRTRSESPRTELSMYVDAPTGATLAVDDAVRWAEGRLIINTEPRSPDNARAPFTAIRLDVGRLRTDSDGEIEGEGRLQATYASPLARIRDQSGRAIESFGFDMSGPFDTYSHTASNLEQADPFVHIHMVKAHAAALTPEVSFINQRLDVNVNINDSCNAFWDGRTVNFFRAGGGCNNSGRVASIVYHEFGHGYHQALTRRLVGSIGEGSGDYLATTITGRPLIGEGFSNNGAGIRRVDRDRAFPGDYVGEVHTDGLIWASALWDLRAAMIAKHGEAQGRRLSDRMFVLALSQGPGLTTSYPAVLAADDDDNTIDNGTPNACEINAIFAAHGLVTGGEIDHRTAPATAWARILHDGPGAVAAGTVTLRAKIENASACGTVDASTAVLAVERDGRWRDVPIVASGDQVQGTVELAEGEAIAYRWSIDVDGRRFTDGSESWPHRVVARAVPVIFEDGFEQPGSGWTHGSIGTDRVDDWMIGPPNALVSMPAGAHGGAAVAGTDLGGGAIAGSSDGIAKPGRIRYLESPPIDTAGRVDVVLQYWEHVSVAGTRTIEVDGVAVLTEQSDHDAPSFGWRFRSIELADTADDRAEAVRVRFVLATETGNRGPGWMIDDVRIGGADKPPPPPPVTSVPPKEPGEATPPARDPPARTPPAKPEPMAPVDDAPPPPVHQGRDPPPDGQWRGFVGGGCTCVPVGEPPVGGLVGVLLVGLIGLRRRAVPR